MVKKKPVINGMMKSMFEADYLLIKHLLSTVFCNGLFRNKGLSPEGEQGTWCILMRQDKIRTERVLRWKSSCSLLLLFHPLSPSFKENSLPSVSTELGSSGKTLSLHLYYTFFLHSWIKFPSFCSLSLILSSVLFLSSIAFWCRDLNLEGCVYLHKSVDSRPRKARLPNRTAFANQYNCPSFISAFDCSTQVLSASRFLPWLSLLPLRPTISWYLFCVFPSSNVSPSLVHFQYDCFQNETLDLSCWFHKKWSLC